MSLREAKPTSHEAIVTLSADSKAAIDKRRQHSLLLPFLYRYRDRYRHRYRYRHRDRYRYLSPLSASSFTRWCRQRKSHRLAKTVGIGRYCTKSLSC